MAVKAREGGSSSLAIGWALFLLLVAGWTVLGSGPPMGLGIEALRGPAREFVGSVGAGTVLLWPLLRLSQREFWRSGWRAAADAWAVSLPTAAAVAPLEALVHWGWGTMVMVVACLVGWTWAAAAVTALATSGRAALGRAGWSVVCVGMAGAGPALSVMARAFGEGARDAAVGASAAAGPVLITERGVGDWSSWWACGFGWVVAGLLWLWVWRRTRAALRP